MGQLRAFHTDRVGLLNSCIAAEGDVVKLRLARPAVLLKRPEDVQHVLVARHAAYPKGARNVGPRAQRILGTGLLTSTAEKHREMRVRVQPAFRRDPVSRFETGILRAVDAMLNRWEDLVEIDVADEMNGLARLALIGTVFGVESGPRVAALEDGMTALRHSMGRAFGWPVTAPAFLPVAVRRDERRAIRRLDETLYELIAERTNDGAGSHDLLSAAVARREGVHSSADARQVRDETLNVAMAAHGNIARALAYTLIEVARHPHVEERLRGEVGAAIGARPPVTADEERLSYIAMTLSESMRLWPPNALMFRVAREDDVLPSGARIRAGWKVLVSPYVVQRDPALYPEPERFDPERFSDEGRRGRPKYAYFPFGGGPRVCIGQTLSTGLCTLTLARLAQRVRLELASEPLPYVCGRLPTGLGPRMRVHAESGMPAVIA